MGYSRRAVAVQPHPTTEECMMVSVKEYTATNTTTWPWPTVKKPWTWGGFENTYDAPCGSCEEESPLHDEHPLGIEDQEGADPGPLPELSVCYTCMHSHWNQSVGKWVKCMTCDCPKWKEQQAEQKLVPKLIHGQIKKVPAYSMTATEASMAAATLLKFNTCYSCGEPHYNSSIHQYEIIPTCPYGNPKAWTCDCQYQYWQADACPYCEQIYVPGGADEYTMHSDKSRWSPEQQLGTKAGLNPRMNLSRQCANFYVLEQLHSRLFPWDGDVRVPRGMYPVQFGSDTRTELLAYAVGKAFTTLEETLADQFCKYLIMACGGELRHAYSRAGHRKVALPGSCKHVCTVAKDGKMACCGAHKTHGARCCKHKHNKDGVLTQDCCSVPGAAFPFTTSSIYTGLSCACPSIHKHRGLHPGSGYKKCSLGLEGCGLVSGCEHLHSQKCCKHKCKPTCCRHKCRNDSDCGGKRPPFEPTPLIRQFMHDHNQGSRSRAWGDWLIVVADKGSEVLLEAALAFNDYDWGFSDGKCSYGGPSWGQACDFVYHYHKGTMSKRSFIDRCWTLHHNGGCIFNKYYQQVGRLNNVLKIQAESHDYTQLVPYASLYVQEMWTSSEALHNKDSHKDQLVMRLSTTARSLT